MFASDRDLAIRDEFHARYFTPELPEAAAMSESTYKWTHSMQQNCAWLLPPLRAIVAAYSAEMDRGVLEKHILLKMLEFSIRMTLITPINFPYPWQLHMMGLVREKGYHRIGFMNDNAWGRDFDSWHLNKAAGYCFRPACGFACFCSEPLTIEYLESHFRNGDFYFY